MNRFDEEIQRRSSDMAAARARADSEERNRATRIDKIEKAKWAEINELCHAAVRQLKAAGVPTVDLWEFYDSKSLWILGRPMSRKRTAGSGWCIAKQYHHVYLTTDAVAMKGYFDRDGHVDRIPINKFYKLMEPERDIHAGPMPMEEYELCKSIKDFGIYALKDALLGCLDYASQHRR